MWLQTNTYQHQKSVQAAQGVKLIAKDLEKALAGLPLYAVHNHDKDEIEYFKVSSTLKLTLGVGKEGRGGGGGGVSCEA